MKKQSLFAVLLLVTATIGFAQVTTSNVKGVVMDSDNQPLFGANVVALHTPTGTKYGGVSNEDGRFNLLNLRVGGPYKIMVSYVGFKNKEFNDVFLKLGQTQNLNVQLLEDSQQLDEVVVVSESGGTFGSDRTGAETSVGRRELTKLPTITRSTNDFTRLEPTASGNGSFGGRNDQFNNFSLDGAIFNNPFGLDAAQPGGQTDATPISIDAIDQIQVSTAPYDVTQSGFTGASVNAVTKSGTNEFHGTVYGFFRNESMTGGKVKGFDVFKADLEQIQYGVSVGGPIVKNKLFFFANFEANDRTDLGSSFVPNTGSGSINESRVTEADFQLVSNILKQVVIGQDAQGNDVFYDPGRYSGFTFDSKSKKGIFKLDWNINDNNRLAIIYNFLDASKEKPAHPTALGSRGPNASTLQFENAGYEINNRINSIQVELNSTISDNITNKLQVGYTHFDDFRNPKSTPAPSITLQSNRSNYIIAGHEPFSIHNKLDQKVLQFTNNMNVFKGDHTYTIGFSFEKFQFDNSFNLGVYGGQGVFFPTGSIDDFRNPANEASLVTFYQNAFNTAISAYNGFNANGVGNVGGWANAETNVGQLAFYVQDEWNITENFKLTYGIRFDRPLFFDSSQKAQEVIDRGALYLPNIPYYNPNNGEEVFFDSTKMPSNDWLISPRVGFNWDVKGDRSLQLRGGSGLFTGRFPFVWLGNQIANPNAYFYQVVDPDYQFPQVWRTNIGVDKRLDNGIVLTADVSYTKDINGPIVQNWGLRPPSATLVGADSRAVYAAGDKGNNAYVFSNSDKGRIFNASLKGEKTFENGLYTMMAYSFLDSKDVNSIEAEITGDAFEANAIVGNANAAVLSPSEYGDKHRIIGVVSKEFSTGTTVSAFFEYARGARYNYVYAGDANLDGALMNDLIYIPTDAEIDAMNWSGAGQAEAFKAFVAQDDYLSDNRGSYAERFGALAPWRGRWDLKILQDIKVSEGNKFQISLDLLNVGNLIHSDWGVIQVPTNKQVLEISVDPNTYEPTYGFDGSLNNTFSYDAGLRSRWQAQIGVRYIF